MMVLELLETMIVIDDSCRFYVVSGVRREYNTTQYF